MLNKLLIIDPSKKSLEFLYKRILVSNYRGNQISQHNRYSFEQVVDMIKIFYDFVGEEKMYIRTTDLKKRPYNLPIEKTYALYTNRVNLKFGKGTQDSIRKNLFVDFHRMGIIDRFGNDSNPLGPYSKGIKNSVALTKLALDLIKSNLSYFQQYQIFSRCLDNLMKGLVTDMLYILSQLDYISLYEYTFFISFARNNLDKDYISLDDVIGYVKEYRTLSRLNKDYVIKIVKDYCEPYRFRGNKKDKRDFHNWINESQQVFSLLDMTTYMSLNKKYNRIELMIKSGYIFNSKQQVLKLKRNLSEKKKYFMEHSESKKIGFELHHVIPLLWAKNSTEFFLLDNWKNMLYIDGRSHAIITQSGNTNVRLNFSNISNDIKLIDAQGHSMDLKMSENVIYDPALKELLKKYNTKLLNSF